MSASSPPAAGFAASFCQPAVGLPKTLTRYDGRLSGRLALMGGSYGNVPALQACLEHAGLAGCDGFAFLGDATGFCGHSDETINIIRRSFSILVAGNHEQKAAAGADDCGCNYENAEDNRYGSIAHRWAMRSLGEANRLWLGTWPDLAVIETAQGSVLLCHGSPARTNEFLYESQITEATLTGWLRRFGAVGLVCTHSGFPWIRRLAGSRFAVNCGVCGKPDHDGDPAVHYATLDLRAEAGVGIEIARVEYEQGAWADQLAREGVDEMFTGSLRAGVWTCGLLSLPQAERARADRADPEIARFASVEHSLTDRA